MRLFLNGWLRLMNVRSYLLCPIRRQKRSVRRRMTGGRTGSAVDTGSRVDLKRTARGDGSLRTLVLATAAAFAFIGDFVGHIGFSGFSPAFFAASPCCSFGASGLTAGPVPRLKIHAQGEQSDRLRHCRKRSFDKDLRENEIALKYFSHLKNPPMDNAGMTTCA